MPREGGRLSLERRPLITQQIIKRRDTNAAAVVADDGGVGAGLRLRLRGELWVGAVKDGRGRDGDEGGGAEPLRRRGRCRDARRERRQVPRPPPAVVSAVRAVDAGAGEKHCGVVGAGAGDRPAARSPRRGVGDSADGVGARGGVRHRKGGSSGGRGAEGRLTSIATINASPSSLQRRGGGGSAGERVRPGALGADVVRPRARPSRGARPQPIDRCVRAIPKRNIVDCVSLQRNVVGIVVVSIPVVVVAVVCCTSIQIAARRR